MLQAVTGWASDQQKIGGLLSPAASAASAVESKVSKQGTCGTAAADTPALFHTNHHHLQRIHCWSNPLTFHSHFPLKSHYSESCFFFG